MVEQRQKPGKTPECRGRVRREQVVSEPYIESGEAVP